LVAGNGGQITDRIYPKSRDAVLKDSFTRSFADRLKGSQRFSLVFEVNKKLPDRMNDQGV
tara:strand:+ start:147 stop:326 length:180 start_codon:yes stop_codon:yes gene_type:complete